MYPCSEVCSSAFSVVPHKCPILTVALAQYLKVQALGENLHRMHPCSHGWENQFICHQPERSLLSLQAKLVAHRTACVALGGPVVVAGAVVAGIVIIPCKCGKSYSTSPFPTHHSLLASAVGRRIKDAYRWVPHGVHMATGPNIKLVVVVSRQVSCPPLVFDLVPAGRRVSGKDITSRSLCNWGSSW